NRRRVDRRLSGQAVQRDNKICGQTIVVQISVRSRRSVYLQNDGRVIDAVASADHGFVVFEGVPGKRSTGREITIRGVDVSTLVQFIARAQTELEVGTNVPFVLKIHAGEGHHGGHSWISEALNIGLWQSQAERLQGIDGGRR